MFIIDQVDDKDAKDSSLNAWKINLSGPPAMVLALVGSVIFIFPFTSFFEPPEDPNPPTSTTVDTQTTVGENTTIVTLVPEVGLPDMPTDPLIVFDETCGEDLVSWHQSGEASGWVVSVQALHPEDHSVFAEYSIDTGFDATVMGNVPAICYFDFTNTEFYLDYWLWIYAYNETGFSEPLFVEYLDRE